MISVSAGHWGSRSGATGFLDEGLENILVAERVTEILRQANVKVNYIQDTVNKSQNDNVNWLVSQHNKTSRFLDLHIHFNSSSGVVDSGIGTEVYVYSEKNKPLAKVICDGIVSAGGFKNRGVKLNSFWGMLKRTNKPCYYVELCFVNSKTDADLYRKNFEEICFSIAKSVASGINVNIVKEEGENLGNKLGETAKNDMREILLKAYNSKIFKKDHRNKVDNMSQEEALNLLISFVNRSSK